MTTEGSAPAVTLKAIGHGRQLTFNALGTPAVVMCVARESADQPQAVVDVVREKWRDAAKVMIVNVADGRAFPKLIHKVAEQIMKSSYNDAVASLEPGMKPEEYVLIAPDWDGKLLKPLGFEDVSKQMGVAVIDGKGRLVGTYQGDDAPAQTMALVEKAIG